jgi:hypothetical protein
MFTETDRNRDAIYREVQAIPYRGFIIPVVILTDLALIVFCYFNFIRPGMTDGKPFPGSLFPVVIPLITIVPAVLAPVILGKTRMITEVRSDGLYVRMAPLQWTFHHVPAEQIEKYEARAFAAAERRMDTGSAAKKKNLYYMGGGQGVAFELSEGRQLLIGSRQPEELARAVASVLRQVRR